MVIKEDYADNVADIVNAAWLNAVASIVNDITDNGLNQKIFFNGTNHAGIRLINLTTAERDALTPQVGDLIFNTTTNQSEEYDGTSWNASLASVSSVFGRTGAVVAVDGDYSQSLITGLKTSDSPTFAGQTISAANATLTLQDTLNTNVPKILFDKPSGGGATDWSIESGISGVDNGTLTFKNTGAGGNTFQLTSTGNFISGHTSPVNTGTSNYNQIHKSDTGNTLLLAEWSATDASLPVLRMLKSGSSTVGTNVTVVDNELIGSIEFNAADGADFFSVAAKIQAEIDGTPGTSDMPGRLIFFTTADGADTATERMRIDSNGNTTFKKTINFDTEFDNGNSGTADTIDWNENNKQKSTLTDNVTYTFTDPGGPASLILRVIQDATGSRTVTWPSSVNWAGGIAPTLTTAANSVDVVAFYYDGSEYHGEVLLDSK